MGKKNKKKGKQGKSPEAPAGGGGLHAVHDFWRWANNPLVADILAAALIAGAEALTRTPKVRKAAQGAVADAGDAAESVAEEVGSIGRTLALAVEEIASRIAAAYQADAGKNRAGSADR